LNQAIINSKSSQKEFDRIKWSEDFSSGLVYLDNHRRNFLDIVNELIEVVNQEPP